METKYHLATGLDATIRTDLEKLAASLWKSAATHAPAKVSTRPTPRIIVLRDLPSDAVAVAGADGPRIYVRADFAGLVLKSCAGDSPPHGQASFCRDDVFAVVAHEISHLIHEDYKENLQDALLQVNKTLLDAFRQRIMTGTSTTPLTTPILLRHEVFLVGQGPVMHNFLNATLDRAKERRADIDAYRLLDLGDARAISILDYLEKCAALPVEEGPNALARHDTYRDRIEHIRTVIGTPDVKSAH